MKKFDWNDWVMSSTEKHSDIKYPAVVDLRTAPELATYHPRVSNKKYKAAILMGGKAHAYIDMKGRGWGKKISELAKTLQLTEKVGYGGHYFLEDANVLSRVQPPPTFGSGMWTITRWQVGKIRDPNDGSMVTQEIIFWEKEYSPGVMVGTRTSYLWPPYQPK